MTHFQGEEYENTVDFTVIVKLLAIQAVYWKCFHQ